MNLKINNIEMGSNKKMSHQSPNEKYFFFGSSQVAPIPLSKGS